MNSTSRALILSTLLGLSTASCIKPLPTPPIASHSGIPVEVPFPPPAARLDVIKDPPSDLQNPVWIDGQWVFSGRRWSWNPGDWESLKEGFGYAPPKVIRRSDGKLVWFQGSFRPLATPGDSDSK